MEQEKNPEINKNQHVTRTHTNTGIDSKTAINVCLFSYSLTTSENPSTGTYMYSSNERLLHPKYLRSIFLNAPPCT